MGFSWVPPPRGARGDDQASIERAAAARNAGIDGFNGGSDAVKAFAAASSEPDEHSQTVDVHTVGTVVKSTQKADNDKFEMLKRALAKLTKSRPKTIDY